MDSARVARRKQVPPPRPPDDEPLPGLRRAFRSYGQWVLAGLLVAWGTWRAYEMWNAWTAALYAVAILVPVAVVERRKRRASRVPN